MSEHRCECSGPGFCAKFRRDMPARLWEVCADRCPPERPCPGRQDYLDSFSRPAPDARSLGAWVVMVNYSRDLAAWVAAGFPLVTPESRNGRRAACDACPLRDPAADRCTHRDCGCYLHPTPLGDALGWATKECPDNRWPLPVVR